MVKNKSESLIVFPELDDNALVSPGRVAEALCCKLETLAVWRSTGRYPLKYIKVGRSVKYQVGSIREFLRSRESI